MGKSFLRVMLSCARCIVYQSLTIGPVTTRHYCMDDETRLIRAANRLRIYTQHMLRSNLTVSTADANLNLISIHITLDLNNIHETRPMKIHCGLESAA